MDKKKRLPDAEFDVMKTIWANTPPVTTNILMQQLGNAKGWKTPALISLLVRLTDRGFLRSDKVGKERQYYPLVEKQDYLKFETGNFMKQYHGNSFSSFITSMCDSEDMNEEELNELLERAKKRRK